MVQRGLVISLFSVSALLGVGTASGQDFPSKPIRIITGDVGGTADFASRLIAQGLSASLGQQAVVENRGGLVVIPAQAVARAAPDGYTLLLFSSNIWVLPFLQNVPYDVVKDFSPITLAVSSPNLLVVNGSLPADSVKDLIAYARSKPAALNYAASGTGSSSHLAAELFKSMAGIRMERVSYKGNGPALNDLISGQVQVMFSTAAAVNPHVKSGRLKALAVTSARPSVLAPGLPTVASSGLPDYEVVAVMCIFAPAKTPRPVVDRLNQEIVRVLNRTDVKEKFIVAGAEVVGNSPAEFAATIQADMARMGKVIKDAGIHGE